MSFTGGSEALGTRPPGGEPSAQQLATLETLGLSYDEVVPELKENGWLEVRALSYDDGGRYLNFIDISPDGVPHDMGVDV